jgi:hypothetical protein
MSIYLALFREKVSRQTSPVLPNLLLLSVLDLFTTQCTTGTKVKILTQMGVFVVNRLAVNHLLRYYSVFNTLFTRFTGT